MRVVWGAGGGESRVEVLGWGIEGSVMEPGEGVKGEQEKRRSLGKMWRGERG